LRDSNSTQTLYINYRGYADLLTQFRNTYIGNGKGGVNTYFDAENSRVGINDATPGYTLDVNGRARFVDSIIVTAVTASIGYARSAHHVGHLVGSYNNVAANNAKSNPIYTIGSAYNPSDAAISGMYGVGFSNGSNAAFLNVTDLGREPISGWGLYVAADGNARIFLDGTNGHIYNGGNLYTAGTISGSTLDISGTISGSGDLYIDGNIRATGYKAFYIDQPNGGKLEHMALEGPEPDVYFRGTSNCSVIDLPDYWKWLVHEDSITVQITPKKYKQSLFTERIENNVVYVSNGNKFFNKNKMDYDFIVHAKRKDIKT